MKIKPFFSIAFGLLLSFSNTLAHASVYTASGTTPRLLVIGDSVMANSPGSRDALINSVGDKVYLPPGFNKAVGGRTAAAVLDNLPQTLSMIVPGQTIVLVGPLGANRGPGSSSVSEIWSQKKQIYDRIIAAGATVVAIPTLPDRDEFQTIHIKDPLRDLVYAYEKGGTVIDNTGKIYQISPKAGFYSVDIGIPNRSVSGSLAYSSGSFNPYTMKIDQSHPDTLFGAPYLGYRTSITIRSLIDGSNFPTSGDPENLLGQDWNFPGSANVNITGVSGKRPTGWNVKRVSGDGNWVISKDQSGNLIVEVSNSPNRSTLQITKDIIFTGKKGDIYDMGLRAYVDPNTTGYQGIQVAFNGSSGFNPVIGYGLPYTELYIKSSGVPLDRDMTSDKAIINLAIAANSYGKFILKNAGVYLRENAAQSLSISGSPIRSIEEGQGYEFIPTITGGTPPYSVILKSGELPIGFFVNNKNGVISGTGIGVGVYSNLSLEVRDSVGNSALFGPFSIEITPIGFPIVDIPPRVIGTPIVGSILSVNNGTWKNTPISFYYQWLSSGFIVPGANSSTYLLQSVDIGQKFSVEVVAANNKGNSQPIRSGETEIVTPGVATTGGFNTGIKVTNPPQVVFSNDGTTARTSTGIKSAIHLLGNDRIIGKKYFEIQSHSGLVVVGLGTNGVKLTSGGTLGAVRYGWIGRLVFSAIGNRNIGNYTQGDIIQIAVDTTNELFWIRKNNIGLWNNSMGADPSSGMGGLPFSGGTAGVYPYISLAKGYDSSATLYAKNTNIRYNPPSGYGAIHTE